jgi:hypothetical protein
MKRQIFALAALFGSAFLFGCGDPSVKDVCGSCSGAVRTACEQAYDVCKDTSGCDLDDLDDAYDVACGGFALTESVDAGL